jgi:hypothetical protein
MKKPVVSVFALMLTLLFSGGLSAQTTPVSPLYPAHVGRSAPDWIEYTSSVAPVIMTE